MNKKQLFENIMKRVNTVVKRSLNENTEYVDTVLYMNTKAVFVGDICYALDEEIYDKVWLDQLHGSDGKIADEDNLYAVVAGTAYGDGTYYDDCGHEFGVDAGVIGVTDLKWMNKDTTIESLNRLGLVVSIPSGQAKISFVCDDSEFSITVEDRVSHKQLYSGFIDTKPEYDDEEYDDYNYDDDEEEEYESVNYKQHKPLNEGAGAGYTVTLEGLQIDTNSIKIISRDKSEVKFTANIKPCVLDRWDAEGYYDAVCSDGIYYDGILMEEYNEEDRKVESGIIEGNLDMRYIDADDDVMDIITDQLSGGITVSAMYGGGWSHCNLGDTFTLNHSHGYEINKDAEDVLITEVTVTAPNIGKDVDWFFENVHKFDEIFGDEGYDEDDF